MSKIDLKAENRNKYYQRYFSMFNSFLLLFKLFFFILLLSFLHSAAFVSSSCFLGRAARQAGGVSGIM
jgi:uncharacterized membrane protein (DUF485 family)